MKDVRRTAKPQQDRQAARLENTRRHKKRRKKRMGFFYALLILFVLVGGTALSITVFFNIESIEIKGSSRYNKEQIINASGIKVGTNLFRFSKEESRLLLEKKLPYLENVKIKRKLPVSVSIEIHESVAAGYIPFSQGYILISQSGKVLETVSELSSTLPLIEGLEPQKATVGTYLTVKNAEQLKQLASLSGLLQKNGLSDVNLIDISDSLNIYIMYQNRLKVELGLMQQMEDKIAFVATIVKDSKRIAPTDTGTVYAREAREIRFIRNQLN